MSGSADLARQLVEVASDKQAHDILLLEVGKISTFADYFVLMSAQSQRQLNTLAKDLAREIKNQGRGRCSVEGTPDSGWILLDCGDVVIHIFGEDERDYYGLEDVWNAGKQVVRLQ